MDRAELEKLALTQLRELASAHRISGSAKLKKTELIATIAKATTNRPPAGVMIPATGRAPLPTSTPAGSSHLASPAPAARRDGPEPGLPIPDRYGRDRLVLMAQDPWHIFAYWEITPETLAHARHAAGANAATVLLIDGPNGIESRDVDLAGGNYYLAVAPDAEFGARLALRGADGRLHILATSNPVRTPAAAPSARTDEAWMAVDETFHELLNLAGLPGEAAGSSGQRLSSAAAARRMVAWNITHTDHRSLFSGSLVRAPIAADIGTLPSSSSSSGLGQR